MWTLYSLKVLSYMFHEHKMNCPQFFPLNFLEALSRMLFNWKIREVSRLKMPSGNWGCATKKKLNGKILLSRWKILANISYPRHQVIRVQNEIVKVERGRKKWMKFPSLLCSYLGLNLPVLFWKKGRTPRVEIFSPKKSENWIIAVKYFEWKDSIIVSPIFL